VNAKVGVAPIVCLYVASFARQREIAPQARIEAGRRDGTCLAEFEDRHCGLGNRKSLRTSLFSNGKQYPALFGPVQRGRDQLDIPQNAQAVDVRVKVPRLSRSTASPKRPPSVLAALGPSSPRQRTALRQAWSRRTRRSFRKWGVGSGRGRHCRKGAPPASTEGAASDHPSVGPAGRSLARADG
jgi:hypothetical protein